MPWKNYCIFSQVEADIIMFSAYNKLRTTGCEDAIVIDSEDTDVYVQAAFVSHHVPGLLCIKQMTLYFAVISVMRK